MVTERLTRGRLAATPDRVSKAVAGVDSVRAAVEDAAVRNITGAAVR
jgi:hypothetical protein